MSNEALDTIPRRHRSAGGRGGKVGICIDLDDLLPAPPAEKPAEDRS